MNFLQKFFINNKLSFIKLLVLDVDGVLTDGLIYIDTQGNETKRFNVKDGLGIKLLQEAGIKIALISGGKSESAIHRAKMLNIKYYYFEVKNKLEVLEDLKNILRIKDSEVLFVGDDLNDLAVKSSVGIFAVPNDGVKAVRDNADLILSKGGGKGAIRELSELILRNNISYRNSVKNGWRGNN
tara:strand:+ start:3177 stop:3725 length:549 start_codon:yes stop_codon:yes gene_type:complete